VFAESPDRVYYIQRGSLPVIPPRGRGAEPITAPQVAPNLAFPVANLWRNATGASPPGALFKPGTEVAGVDSDAGVNGTDFLWENCILVINRNGDIIENWTQWDKMLRRPHSVYISPYDPQKHVYVVDDYRHAIFKFTNDGKQLVKTIGTPNRHGSDSTHFYRPTFMAFNTDGSWYNSDGYANTRVVKFDKNDNYVTAWGERGTNAGPGAKPETRPNYFNNVHGVAWTSPPRRSTSTIAATAASRSSTRMASSSGCGRCSRVRRGSTCTSSSSTRIAACGCSTR
jgi:hypothetical protein